MPTSWLANPRETRAVLSRHGFYLKRRLGQNFLVDDGVIRRIMALSEVTDADCVLEVGPGIGTLTVALLAAGAHVVAIEADRELPRVLSETCAEDGERLTLIEGDALKVIPDGLKGVSEHVPTKLVSNLPYQVAATVILKALVELDSIARLVVMVQAEVADRICAAPSTKAYGAYTAKLALLARLTGRFEVPPTSFMPPPHVMSSVVRIEREPVVGADEYACCARVIDAAFSQRRKTLRNSLHASGFAREELDAAFEECGISGGVRAETLAPEDFVLLTRALAGKDA